MATKVQPVTISSEKTTPQPVEPVKAPAMPLPAPQPSAQATAPIRQPAPSIPPPPPPSMPARPRRVRPLATAPEPTPQAPPPSAYPVLSKDPAEREKQLEGVRGEAGTILAILEMVTARLTPTMPLTSEEKAAIQDPLEQVLFKYGGAVPCEVQLMVTLGLVALPRYGEWKKNRPVKIGETR